MGAYNVIAFRIMVASLYQSSFAVWLHQSQKLYSVKCSVYLFVAFQKKIQAKFVFASGSLPFPPKPIRISASEHPYFGKWTAKLEETAGIQKIVVCV